MTLATRSIGRVVIGRAGDRASTTAWAVALGWALAVVAIAAVAGRRWAQLGAPVSGLDAGQWLALGRGLLGGEGRSTPGAYPPLVPLLTALLREAVGPMAAARAVGTGSLAAVMAATYLAARGGTNAWLATSAVTTVGLASVVAEPVAYGGYPQNWALAFLVVGAFALARYLEAGGRARLMGVAAALAGAAFAHHMYFPVAGVVCGAVWLAWLGSRPPAAVLRRRTLGAAAAGGVGLVCFLPTAVAFQAAGYDPPVNAGGLGLAAALRYGVREAPVLWALVLGAGLLGLVATARRPARGATWSVAVALIAASALLFPVTAEVRLLPPLVLGATLGLALGLDAAWRRPRTRGGRAARLAWLAPTAALAVPLLLWPRADAQAASFFRYYQVVDAGLLAAARAVDEFDPPGLVVVREGQRGWPVGWWFEGLTDARIAVGGDPKWLGFGGERARATLADELFGGGRGRRTSAETVALARRAGVTLLVFRKWEWIGWQRWAEEPAPATAVLYDDGAWMVIDVAGRRPESGVGSQESG